LKFKIDVLIVSVKSQRRKYQRDWGSVQVRLSLFQKFNTIEVRKVDIFYTKTLQILRNAKSIVEVSIKSAKDRL
jgi:hypothetical protein